jgi:hypothetical protein
MIYEIALLPIHLGRIERFKRAFAEVAPLLTRAKDYGGQSSPKGSRLPRCSI